MDKSTPRPWAVGTVNPYEDEPDEISILSASGYCVAIAIPQGTGRDETPARTVANAALIVQAVNSHDELVGALAGLLKCRSVDILEESAREYPHGKEDVADIVAAFDRARAALALATKETP